MPSPCSLTQGTRRRSSNRSIVVWALDQQQSWRIHLPIALRNPKLHLQLVAESCALCPILVAHRVFELWLGEWAGWQIHVVGAAGNNTSIFARSPGAASNFICFDINIHHVVLDADAHAIADVLGQNGAWRGKYQSQVDDLESVVHTVIGAQRATFASSLPRSGNPRPRQGSTLSKFTVI
ncbi:hypothetical protein DFH08DRAFT_966623 [Mycena albidolilacea]|uniref:Uncharacterized protein n=1 Tax=Mycena albidolilacea TaxID=1033008 RepID=A0AAD6ZNC7_9AGAR|nr:hypothetical protein DFH08DRAFT_966623 [Mycena albidolilacea]